MRVAVRPGTPIGDVNRRQIGRGFWLPTPTGQGVVAASSMRATATATAHATPHTKGAWAELLAATTQDVTALTLSLVASTFTSNTDTSTLLSLSTGASGDEDNHVIVSNLAVGYRQLGDRYEIPILVPGGSRLAIQVQSAVTVKAVQVTATLGLLPFGRRPPNHLVTMGANLGTSRGVSLGSPGVAGDKGSWVEIVASTTEPFGALVLGPQCDGDVSIGGLGLLDIGVGASSEQTVIGDLAYQFAANESLVPAGGATFPCDIPLGSRLVARFSRSVVSASGGQMDLILYGVPRQ